MPTPLVPADFFASIRARYPLAEAAVGLVERSYLIGGQQFRLRLAGSALIPQLTPALDHLAVAASPGRDGLTIYVWDSVSTGVPFQIDSWSALRPGLSGHLSAYSDDRFTAAIQPDAGLLTLLDRTTNTGLYWAQHIDLPVFEQSAPFKLILHWWLRDRGYVMIHAAAVGTADGAALLIGQTGSGKSTAALTCLAAGMQYLADDRCLITTGASPRVYALYNSGKVAPAQARRLAKLTAAFQPSSTARAEKAVLFAHHWFPEQVSPCLPIKVILLAQLAHAPATRLEAIRPMTALQTLAASTMIYAPGWSQVDLEVMADLVQQIPCYRLQLGSDQERIPEVIAGVLQAEIARLA